jgi:hypothetical protein
MDPNFFKSLDQATTILERGFQLLRDRKIIDFTPSIINDLLEGDHDTMIQLA